MHQALPPRKFSHAPNYTRSTLSSSFRRKRLKVIGLIALGVLVLYLGITNLSSSEAVHIPSGSPEVVIVTVMEPDLSSDYVAQIKENRDEYAARHGEGSLIPNLGAVEAHSITRLQGILSKYYRL